MKTTFKTPAIIYICKSCKNKGIWNGLPLKHRLDHMDLDIKNMHSSNIQLLCPNCYSQKKKYLKKLS
jgi:hypothetical protein